MGDNRNPKVNWLDNILEGAGCLIALIIFGIIIWFISSLIENIVDGILGKETAEKLAYGVYIAIFVYYIYQNVQEFAKQISQLQRESLHYQKQLEKLKNQMERIEREIKKIV